MNTGILLGSILTLARGIVSILAALAYSDRSW